MFSQASVILSRGGTHGRGHAWRGGGVCDRGFAEWVCMAGGMHGRRCVRGKGACMAGGCAWQGVRILLECILVFFWYFGFLSAVSPKLDLGIPYSYSLGYIPWSYCWKVDLVNQIKSLSSYSKLVKMWNISSHFLFVVKFVLKESYLDFGF